MPFIHLDLFEFRITLGAIPIIVFFQLFLRHISRLRPTPKRKVRRANDLRWLVERLAPLVETREADAQESEHLAVLVETAVALGERSRELLQESAPSFGELISNLKSRADEAESEKQESPPPEPATAAEEPKESEDQKEKEAEPAVEKAQEPAPAPQEPAKETPPASPPRKTAACAPWRSPSTSESAYWSWAGTA